ncbi:hypothetical protein Syun_028547 [Stephania yunnanensis]|uniref:Uncharacterized protein n=1 Tax=Stephania yunnanensis TaxID=152371 RepID=A0AAP0EHK8_9MAGN
MTDEQTDYIVLGEEILAFRMMGGEFRDRPGHHGLNLHVPLFQNLGENRTHTRVDHMINALRVTTQKPNSPRSILLPFHLPLLHQFQERRHSALFDDEFAVAIVVPGEGDERGGGIGSVVERALVEGGDLFPD